MHATSSQPASAAARLETRVDWVEWYEALSKEERQELRNRLLQATYDEVKQDAELRNYFFFHSEDITAEKPPGADRMIELHSVVQMLRGATDPDLLEQRRKAVAFLLGEYQRYLRDNPWA